MKIIFMGTPEFAVPVLDALYQKHDIVCVYTQPPRPSGRGMELMPTPIEQEARNKDLQVRCPENFKNEADLKAFEDLKADVSVVCAYGLLLPKRILDACPKGCINIHPSLLPRWRGAAPIQRAIMAGDKQTGVCIMKMSAGLDTGDVFLKKSVKIDSEVNAGDLHDKLADLSAEMILQVLDKMPKAVPQADEGATYAHKITKDECLIDWNKSAEEIHNFIRGLAPYPKAYFNYQNEKIKVLSSKVISKNQCVAPSGTLLDDNLTVACGKGTLQLECLQRAGKSALSRDDFLRGFRISRRERF